jgi:putative cardiolipin synthase
MTAGRSIGRRRAARTGAAAICLAISLGVPALADVFRILDEDQEAAQARIDLVQQARLTLDAEYFIVENDQVSLVGLALLRDAARRGVAVRVIVDGSFNRMSKAIQAYLATQGVEIKEYHPFRLAKPRWWTRRLHDKLLVADGERMLTGGRNVANSYFGFGGRNYVDRDAFVVGRAAADAHAYFHDLWHSGEVRKTRLGEFAPSVLDARCENLPREDERWRCTLRRKAAADAYRRAEQRLDEAMAALGLALWVHLDTGTDWAEGQRDVGEVRFLHDPVGRKREERGIGNELLDLMRSASDSLVIESPYLVPSRAFLRGLREVLGRGVTVRVLTNSLNSTDNLLAQAGYVGKKRKLVNMGVEIWEFSGPESMHAKSAVTDRSTSIIGTFNLDPRSEYLNTELAVVATDAGLSERLRASMDAHLEKAFRIGPDGKPVGGKERYPGASRMKILKLNLLRLLAPFIHRQI